EFHEIRIAVGNAKPSEETNASINAFFGLVKILVKIVINDRGDFLSFEHAVLNRVPVQPLIGRGKLFVGKSRTEQLMTGKLEKVCAYPTLGDTIYLVVVQIRKARRVGLPVGLQNQNANDGLLGIFSRQNDHP